MSLCKQCGVQHVALYGYECDLFWCIVLSGCDIYNVMASYMGL